VWGSNPIFIYFYFSEAPRFYRQLIGNFIGNGCRFPFFLSAIINQHKKSSIHK